MRGAAPKSATPPEAFGLVPVWGSRVVPDPGWSGVTRCYTGVMTNPILTIDPTEFWVHPFKEGTTVQIQVPGGRVYGTIQNWEPDKVIIALGKTEILAVAPA